MYVWSEKFSQEKCSPEKLGHAVLDADDNENETAKQQFKKYPSGLRGDVNHD